MAQSTRKYTLVGDYIKGKQIGEGSFSKVWHARHRVHGTEVAIKEIPTARLNPKLQESLKSEIFILKRINHPNIIRLHDMIEEPGTIYIILEYCKGGDLSMHIQHRQGRIPEASAKHFMLQLAEGLKVLREYSLIHRDLKPQNLLLSTKGDNGILKIADFGFARSLTAGLAETLCGSPLYMAPEIMQSKKYDAKADLWSVGAILFQLVTGKTPFTGSNQIQLLQNIIKSIDLQFPSEAKDLSPDCIDLCKKLLRRNPVERLTFEEFFNHPYLSERQPDQSFRSRQSETVLRHFRLSEGNEEQGLQDDLPFTLDDDTAGSDGSPSFPKKPSMKSMYGFSVDSKPDRRDLSNPANRTDSSWGGVPHHMELTSSSVDSHQLSGKNLKYSLKTTEHGGLHCSPKVLDSLESIDQDYVIVSGPPVDLSTSANSFKPGHFPSKFGSCHEHDFENMNISRDQTPVVGGSTPRVSCSTSPEEILSNPGISQGSMDIADVLEQTPTDSMAQIRSLQHYAAAITELVNTKIEGGKQLEAFSVQLANLSIWKQALHICHAHAASAMEGSPQETARLMEVSKAQHDSDARDRESLDIADKPEQLGICSQIERAFLHEVGLAEELSKAIEPGNMEMPDAMELIYQSALALGRHGAVDEYMGDISSAVVSYSKAVGLFQFLLLEAPSLILNPRFSLTNLDRYRIQNYINVLNNRQNVSRSLRMAIFKAGDQPFPS